MASILVFEPSAIESEHACVALRRSGHEARRGDGSEDPSAYGAVLADLQLALDRGWLGGNGANPLPVPLIVSSKVAAFLANVASSVAGTVLKPTTAEDLVRAVERVLASDVREGLTSTELLADPERDALVESFGGPNVELAAVADLVARGLGTPMALVTLMSSVSQRFVGQSGLPTDLALALETPRSWSFCQHAVTAGSPLVIEDAAGHPLLGSTPLVKMNLIRAYAGVPIEVGGVVVGTVCALSNAPHHFDEKDLATLELAARLAGIHLALQAASRKEAAQPRQAKRAGGLQIGDLLDHKYWITARLGSGGLSDVLLARDSVVGQMVAIKVMRTITGEQTLLREATALARVRHPNIVQVHGWGRTHEQQLYLVLEYLSGEPLKDRLAADAQGAAPLHPSAALKILRELAGALATLHAAGIFHGDIKPDNVILDVALDRAVLIDFGLGLGGDFRGGTPGFSAPEQFATDTQLHLSPLLDVYGLAALAYVMFAGKEPFHQAHGLARVAYQMLGELEPASRVRPGLPKGLDAVLARGMSVDPSLRHDSVLAFAHAIEEVLSSRSQGIPALAQAGASLPASRGGSFRLARAEVTERRGAAEEAKILASIADIDRAVVESVVDDEAWHSTAALVAYLEAYAGGDPQRVEDLATAVTGAVLPGLLRTIPVARTPSTMLHLSSPLLYRFHDWGKIVITQTTPENASLTLRMPNELAPIMCRYLRGSLLALLRFAAAKPKISEEWCLAHGAGACELKISW